MDTSAQMTRIYESPDGGATVYSRESGSLERSLERSSIIDSLRENQMWGEIRRMAPNHPALQEALDRVKIIYQLSRVNE